MSPIFFYFLDHFIIEGFVFDRGNFDLACVGLKAVYNLKGNNLPPERDLESVKIRTGSGSNPDVKNFFLIFSVHKNFSSPKSLDKFGRL